MVRTKKSKGKVGSSAVGVFKKKTFKKFKKACATPVKPAAESKDAKVVDALTPSAASGETTKAAAAAANGGSASKERIAGYIFMCNTVTKPECYNRRVFGLPKGKLDVVERIKPGTKLFLFDFDLKLLYGVYKASGVGGENLEVDAFHGKFPAQVKFRIVSDCLPLTDKDFRDAIKENYHSKFRFEPELKAHQVRKLLALFRPIDVKKHAASEVERQHSPLRRAYSPRPMPHLPPLIEPRYAPEVDYAPAHDLYAHPHDLYAPLAHDPYAPPARDPYLPHSRDPYAPVRDTYVPPARDPYLPAHDLYGPPRSRAPAVEPRLPPPAGLYHQPPGSGIAVDPYYRSVPARGRYPDDPLTMDRYPAPELSREAAPSLRDYRSVTAGNPPSAGYYGRAYDDLNRSYLDSRSAAPIAADGSQVPVSSLHSFVGPPPAYR